MTAITYIALEQSKFDELTGQIADVRRLLSKLPALPILSAAAPAEQELYKYSEAADFLRVSKRYVEQLVAEGKIATVSVGKSPRIQRTELIQYLDNQKKLGLKTK
ncbi:MAG: helix-turn-helix domain-containing protein [Prevotellaceae bacterium]|jgi:excisionase family DNA binding protein|nr:helix-turn-helix domain-containing protein [Prevotellaceae bacterium]